MADDQFFWVSIPKGFSESELETIGEDVIDFIRERTADGKSWRNRAFAGYSDSYVKSLNFKIAGKSKNDVNLTQSGDMLGALEVLEIQDGRIKIGIDAGKFPQEAGKAEGNILGTYGQAKQVGPKRDFLGITKGDLARIVDGFTPEDAAAGKGARDALKNLSGEVVTSIDEEDDG
jgi:hypothetical protein